MAVRHVVAAVAAVALVASTFVVTRSVYSQDKPEGMSEEDMKEMQLMMEQGTPTDEHKKLAEFVGTWNLEMSMVEKGKETKAAGTATVESILGGRAVLSTVKADMMGMPF